MRVTPFQSNLTHHSYEYYRIETDNPRQQEASLTFFVGVDGRVGMHSVFAADAVIYRLSAVKLRCLGLKAEVCTQ